MKDFKNEVAGALQLILDSPGEHHKLYATASFANELINYIAQDANDFLTKLSNTLIAKNHDYGDAFFKVATLMGVFNSFSIRLLDKGFRLENLTSGTSNMVSDESVMDTKVDLVGYLVLLIVAYDDILGGH